MKTFSVIALFTFWLFPLTTAFVDTISWFFTDTSLILNWTEGKGWFTFLWVACWSPIMVPALDAGFAD